MGKSSGQALALAICCIAATTAAEDVEVQTLQTPSPGDAQLLGVHSTKQNPRGALSVGASLNYIDEPLVLVDPTQGDRRVTALVDDQLSLNLAVAYGVHERVEVGAGVPVILFQQTGDGGGITSNDGVTGLGDARLFARFLLFGQATSGFSLAARGALSLPTAVGADYAGQPTVGFSPELVASFRTRLVLVSANLGARVRKRTNVGDLEVGSGGRYGLGVAVAPWDYPVYLLGEASGEVAGISTSKTPLELRGGLRWDVTADLTLLGGYGRGVIGGYGAPDHRGLLTAAYRLLRPKELPPKPVPAHVTTSPENPDPDSDGILGDADACPEAAEDFDGFEDENGCPEEDNDGDGLLDEADECRNHAEDRDGFTDEDGCPDPDNDMDGLLDENDRCPIEPEIINGVDDDDGCPDEGRQLVTVGSTKIAIAEKLFFAHAKDEILAKSEAVLAQLATTLQRMQWLNKIRIEGHTDDRGDATQNRELSQRRAESVRKALLERGVASVRLEAVGYGEEQPVDTNQTLVGRANNRRVEFVILEQDPPPPGFRPPPNATLSLEPASNDQPTKEAP